MDHFPIFLALKNQRALIVGGSPLATRKAALIAKSGAIITVIAAEFSPPMRALAADNPRIELSPHPFEASSLDDTALVLAATDDAALNQRVYDAAQARGIPVNVADQPELCSYILPAIIDRNPVVVAVSTGGASPVLARYIKSLLERALPQTLGTFAELLKRWRQSVSDAIPNGKQRRRFWEKNIHGPVGKCALTGDIDAAEKLMEQQLEQLDSHSNTGCLTLIGAPSSDPELLSIKAHRLIQMAEWVFYDDDTPQALLELSRREAHTFNVDRYQHEHALQTLLEQVRLKQRVVRIYGRDCTLDQEASTDRRLLAQQGIEHSVVAAPRVI